MTDLTESGEGLETQVSLEVLIILTIQTLEGQLARALLQPSCSPPLMLVLPKTSTAGRREEEKDDDNADVEQALILVTIALKPLKQTY